MKDDGYIRSVRKAVATNGLLYQYSEGLMNLPMAVSAAVPFEVKALLGVHDSIQRHFIVARVLALKGYDPLTASHIANTFRETFPDFNPDVARLMSKEQLIKEHGTITGDLIASLLTDPGKQPILRAMLLRDDPRQPFAIVERSGVVCEFGGQFYEDNSPRAVQRQMASPWDLVNTYDLTQRELEAHYYHATDGMTLERTVAVSLDPDNMEPEQCEK